MSVRAAKGAERSTLAEEKDCSLDVLYPRSRMSTETSVDEEGDEAGMSRPAQDVRLRRSPSTIVPSCSESSISDYEDTIVRTTPPPPTTTPADGGRKNGITLDRLVNSTLLKKRLSRQSSLPWGHKPSPLIGASCFLFLLPVPLLLRACCPVSAFLLCCVTVSSYLSDHVYTGVESWTHTLDRVLAPVALASNIHSIYSHHGVLWALSSLAAIKCHVWANYYSKHGMYDQFVIWHSLWHAVGVGLIVLCFTVNGTVGTCWEGSKWEDIFRERFMI